MKKKNKIFIPIILIILLLVTCGVSYYFITDYRNKAAEAERALEEQLDYIEANTKYLYVVTAEDGIKKGDIIEDGVNVECRESLTALDSSVYIDESYLGSVAVVNIKKDLPVFVNMVATEKITNDLREIEVSIAQLPLNAEANEYYDLRIRFATGQDYIVASKLRMKEFDIENSLFYTDMNESEMLVTSCATVEAYLNAGTKVYLAKYEEANLQEDAEPTYPVNDAVRNLIATDPNIIEVAEGVLNTQARNTLRSYLGMMSREELEAVQAGDGLADTAHGAAMSAQSNAFNSEEYLAFMGDDTEGEE